MTSTNAAIAKALTSLDALDLATRHGVIDTAHSFHDLLHVSNLTAMNMALALTLLP